MSWVKARIKQVMGRKKETDGIVLGDERMRAEGQREKEDGRENRQVRHDREDR